MDASHNIRQAFVQYQWQSIWHPRLPRQKASSLTDVGSISSKAVKTNGQPNVRDTQSVPRVRELFSVRYLLGNTIFKTMIVFENFKRV